MKQTTNFQPDKLIKSYKRRRHLRRAVAVLSAVVLLFTINSLKMDADTLQRTAMCGLEEHAHTTTCYPLTCGLAESEPVTELRRYYVGNLTPHFHTDACYDRNGEMRETDSVMRMVALHGSGSAISGVRIDYVEVRLTDSFARKIEDASESMRVAV